MTNIKFILDLGDKQVNLRELRQLLQSGASAVKVNFSHGPISFHIKTIDNIRTLNNRLNMPVVVIQEISNPNQDLFHLEIGIKSGVDFITLPIIKTETVEQLKKIIKSFTGRHVPIIAKIDSIKNLDEIIKVTDALMLRNLNKTIIDKCIQQGIPLIFSLTDTEANLDHIDAVTVPTKSFSATLALLNSKRATDKQRFDNYQYRYDLLKKRTFKESEFVHLAHYLIHFGLHARVQAIVVSSLELARALAGFRPPLKIVFASNAITELKKSCLVGAIRPLRLKGSLVSTLKNHEVLKKGERYVDATEEKGSAKIELMA